MDRMFDLLSELNILEDTYIIYSTDNGYHLGQYRLRPGKTCAIEHDINIPLFIRGPGMPKNVTAEVVTTHTDLVPTIFNMFGMTPLPDFDGVAIPLSSQELAESKGTRHEHVNVEYWGFRILEGEDSKLEILCMSKNLRY